MLPTILVFLLALSPEAEGAAPVTIEAQTAQLRAMAAQFPKLSLDRTVLAIQPPGADWALDMVSSVAADRTGVIWLLQRGEKADPIIAVNREGKVLRSWGKGLYKIPHSIRIDPVTGKLLGSVESTGHHSIDVTADGELFTGTRPNQVLWFRPER
jgi:hypothetical protein